MDTQSSQEVESKFPTGSLSVVLLSLLSYFCTPVWNAFVFRRDAILSGDVWRLITGHFAHFSLEHLAYNITAFAVLGIIIERHYRTNLAVLLLALTTIISATLLMATPDLAVYGGLSGVNFGLVTFLATLGLYESGAWRVICIASLVLVGAKLGIEITTGRSILPYLAPQPFVLVPASHLAGSITGIACGLGAMRYKISMQSP